MKYFGGELSTSNRQAASMVPQHSDELPGGFWSPYAHTLAHFVPSAELFGKD